MQLSIIILNYKVPYYLLNCLESVRRSIVDIDAEIIVIDNHSEDESCELVKKHFPEVKLIANPSNDGFSKGNNIGIKEAKGEYLCLLNPDTIVQEDIFKNCLSFAKKNPNFGALGPQLIDGCGRFLPESKRHIPTPKIALQKLLNNSTNYYADIDQNRNGKVEILVGAFMFMKKDRYFEVGQLDEDYFMYGEDIDLSYKFIKFGYQNYYLGEEIVVHYKGESTAKNKTYRKRFYGAMQIFYTKHFKNNFLSKTAVNIGLQFAKLIDGLRSKKETPIFKIKTIIWVSNQDALLPQLNKIYQQRLTRISLENLPTNFTEKTLVIFDTSHCSYAEIIKSMKQLSSPQTIFRIKPNSFNFIIGSDSSVGKGKLIKL